MLDQRFRELPSEEWLRLIRHAGFTAELINTPADAATDPTLRDAGVIVPQRVGNATDATVGCPIWFDGLPARVYPAAPGLNQDSREALSACGFSGDEIDALEQAGLVGRAQELSDA